jgi:hypothetical protein
LHFATNSELPHFAAAVLSALRLQDPSIEGLKGLTDSEWNQALSFCDRAQLTLLLGDVCSESLPPWVERRIRANLANNRLRNDLLQAELRLIAAQLKHCEIDYLLLKGFAHGSRYAKDPGLRQQYDIDLFAPQEMLIPARDALHSLGYESLTGFDHLPTDHLPVMVQKTGWRWRGDFFDPEIPPSIDLHFRFWDPDTERFEAPGLDAFWERRISRDIEGAQVPVLSAADEFGYAALHTLRHLLRGSLRIYHVYELAYFLNLHAHDVSFWNEWNSLHPADLRRLEAISFELARTWFACRLAPLLEEQTAELDEPIRQWMDLYAAAPVLGMFRPNKAELWLHLSLLDSARATFSVARRRIIPLQRPTYVESAFVPQGQITFGMRLREKLRRDSSPLRISTTWGCLSFICCIISGFSTSDFVRRRLGS